MTSSIQTPRLQLDPLRVEDADDMVDLLDDERLYRYTGGAPQTREELRTSYARQVDGLSRGWLNWVVRMRDSGAIVGTVQATRFDDHGRDAAELAWVVVSRRQGNGYAREAAAAVATWLREQGVEMLVAHVHPEHAASVAVARSLGMTPGATRSDGEVRWTTAG